MLGHRVVEAEAGPAPAAAQLVQAGVRGDPVHPGAGGRPPIEAGQPADDGDERLLRGVGRVGRVPGQTGAHGVDEVEVAPQQGVERGAVAGLGRGDELVVGR